MKETVRLLSTFWAAFGVMLVFTGASAMALPRALPYLLVLLGLGCIAAGYKIWLPMERERLEQAGRMPRAAGETQSGT